jgi:hypothetical protein
MCAYNNSVKYCIYLRAYSTSQRPITKQALANERNKTNIYLQTKENKKLRHLNNKNNFIRAVTPTIIAVRKI